MERIKSLNRYQKIVLLLLTAMLVVFTVIYFVVSSRVGFAYKGAILRPQDDGGSTIYSGRISGETASFTVTQDKTVTFHYGDKMYGPYTAREDPSAVPKDDSEMAKHMTGVEIREGDNLFFRGGVLATGGSNREMMLFDEDGGFASVDVLVSSGNGVMYDSEGNVVDQMAPSATTILRLMDDPELTSKGSLFVDDRFRQRSLSDIVHGSGLRNVGNRIPKLGRQKTNAPCVTEHHLDELTEIVAVHSVLAIQVFIHFCDRDQLKTNVFHNQNLHDMKSLCRPP